MELSSRVSGAGRACALVVAFVLPAARAAAADSASPVPAAEVAAPPPELASSVAAPAPPPAPADEAHPEPYESVVVAHRSRGQVARDPTASATVIDAGRFEGEAKNVAELVATAPGVAVSDYGGLGHLATVSIRGATADGVLVLLDGLPLNSAAGGGVDLASIPRHWIDRIEVIRGVEGAVYGAGALGGVVNVVTRAGGGPASAEATAGSFATYSAGADASTGPRDAWVLAAASGESSGGAFSYLFDPQPALAGSPLVPSVRENNAVTRGGLLLKGALSSQGRRLDALLQVSGGRREIPGRPYHLTRDDWARDARALASVRLAVPALRDGLTLAARGTARGDLLDVHLGGLSRQRGGAAEAVAEALLDHGVGILQAFASGGGEVLAADGLRETRRRATVSATLSEALLLSRMRIGPAFRIDRIGPFTGWSAKLGGAAALPGGLSLHASSGRTFRAPSFSELFLQQGTVTPNPLLHPEQGLGGDAAVVGEGRWGLASIGGHATLYDDLIYYQPTGLTGLKPFNAGRTLAAGLEVEGATAPLGGPGLTLETAYTLLRTEILRGISAVVGKDVPRRPRHRLFARVAAAPRSRALGAHLEVHLVGRQFEDDFNSRPIPAATVWNAGAWARILPRPEIRAQFEVKNLLDDRTLLDPLANPLPGRMVLFTLRVEAAGTKGSVAP